MDVNIAFLLTQNGLTVGAIYTLLALVLVMVFSVTRIILIPQGEIIVYAVFTFSMVKSGQTPGTVWLLAIAGLAAAAMEYLCARNGHGGSKRKSLLYGAVPAAIALCAWLVIPLRPESWLAALVTLALVVPLGPLIYRIAFRPASNASVLILLIVAMAVHYVLTGLGLIFFGAEGVRSAPMVAGRLPLGGVSISLQALFVMGATAIVIFSLAIFFMHSIQGKALRACAFNRTGARLVGICAESAGTLAFLLAALIGAVSGLLIGPLTTIYYDTGFLFGLKGFVAGILGGLVSYPLAAAGALVIGLLESASSFWTSTFKDAIVFSLLIPILLWRNLISHDSKGGAE